MGKIRGVVALQKRIDELEDSLRGVAWMLEQGALIRDVSKDGNADYTTRSVAFAMWMKRTFSSIYNTDLEY